MRRHISIKKFVRPSVTPSLRWLLGASYAEYSALLSLKMIPFTSPSKMLADQYLNRSSAVSQWNKSWSLRCHPLFSLGAAPIYIRTMESANNVDKSDLTNKFHALPVCCEGKLKLGIFFTLGFFLYVCHLHGAKKPRCWVVGRLVCCFFDRLITHFYPGVSHASSLHWPFPITTNHEFRLCYWTLNISNPLGSGQKRCDITFFSIIDNETTMGQRKKAFAFVIF